MFHLQDGIAHLEVWHATGNATIAPLVLDKLPGEEISAGVREIIAAGDDPSAANATAPLASARRSIRPMRLLVMLAAILAVAVLASMFALVPVPCR